MRWLLSERAQRDVGDEAAIAAMRAHAEPSGSAATLAVVDFPTTPLERFTDQVASYLDEDPSDDTLSPG